MPVITALALAACAWDPSPDLLWVPEVNGRTPTTTPVVLPDWTPIPASVRIFGLELEDQTSWEFGVPNMALGYRIAIVDAYGGYPGTLVLAASGTAQQNIPEWKDLPNEFFVPGDLSRGDHGILDVRDGGLTREGGLIDVFPAGDTDRDGHPDLWVGPYLFHGPVLGRDLTLDDATAVIDTSLSVGFGDFDADGDGELDVVFVNDWQVAEMHHGPFAGFVPQGPDTSVFGDVGCADAYIARLPDYGGPGADAFGFGYDPGDCGGYPTYLYDLYGPRGRDLYFDDALAATIDYPNMYVEAAGDLDGDGDGDVLWGSSEFAHAFAAPVPPVLGPEAPRALVDDGEWGLSPAGDVDGDGAPDFLTYIGPEDHEWVGLLLSPLPPIVDLDAALPIGPRDDAWSLGAIASVQHGAHGDLDGDGRSDLVLWSEGDTDQGVVSIWYAEDLMAAWDAWSAAR